MFQVFYRDSECLIAVNSLIQEQRDELSSGIVESVTNSKLLQKIYLSGRKVYLNKCFLIQHFSALLRKKKGKKNTSPNDCTSFGQLSLQTVAKNHSEADRFPLTKNIAVVHLQKCQHFVVVL